MAIVTYTEHWQGAGSTSNRESGTSARVFDVIVDGADAPYEHLLIERSPLFPLAYDVHPYEPYLFVSNKSATENPGPKKYKLTIEYGSIGNPEDIPPQIEWTYATSSEPIDRDFDGNAITNSAGETSDPPLNDEKEDQIYRLVYNSFTFDILRSAEYKGAVNSDVWFGFEPGHAKVITLSGTFNGSETVPFWTITQEVQIRFNDTWEKRYLDQGFRKKTGTDADGNPEYETIKDKNGDPVSQPVLLDGEGAILKDGEDPVFLTVWTRAQLPFDGIILAIT